MWFKYHDGLCPLELREGGEHTMVTADINNNVARMNLKARRGIFPINEYVRNQAPEGVVCLLEFDPGD